MNSRLLRALVVLVLLAGLCVVSTKALAQTRIPITVSNTALPAATLTDYTVRVDINSTNAPGFDFTNNGDDLVALNSDTTAFLDFYVENVDPVAQTAIVWIRVPSVPPSPPDTELFLDYNRTDVTTPLSSLVDTFVNNGFTYHSQPHFTAAPGPETRAAAEAEFNFNEVTSDPDYGCTTLSQINDDHSDIFTANGDFGLAITSQFIVPTGALYEFRLGADFGNGGELYIDDVALEADWTDDLWWAQSYTNPDLLQGSRFLDAGSHTLRALGYELCCDGPASLQYRFDTDGDGSLADETFADLTTSSPGITLLAPSCPTAQVTLGPVTTVPVTLAKLSSFKAGPFVKLDWETADETFNAGFNVWTLVEGENGEESLERLNRHLIRSQRFDSTDTLYYSWRINARKYPNLTNLALSSVDINGVQEFFGPFDIGETYGESFTPQPINWQSVHAEFEKSMQQRGYQRIANRWRKQRTNTSASGASASGADVSDKQAVQITVQETGVYRVTYEDLLVQGIDWTGVDRRQIAVTHDGKPIPRAIVKTKRRKFGPGSAIDFVGVAPDDALSIYQHERRYQLQLDSSLTLPIRRIRRSPSNAADWHYQSQVKNADNQHVIFSPLESPWVMDLVFRTSAPAKVDYQFELPELVEGQPSKLAISLGGIANAPRQDFNGDGALDPHHEISILVNDQPITRLSFDGQREEAVDMLVPAGVLQPGLNTVSVQVEVTGYGFDVAVVDSVSLSYPVLNEENADLSFAVDSGQSAGHDGIQFSATQLTATQRRGLIAYAYRDDHNLMRLRPHRVSRRGVFTVPFIASGEAQYFVGQSSALLKPSSVVPLDTGESIALLDTDMLVISHPNFIGDSLQDYLQARRLQGVESQLVSTDSIQSSYGPDVPLHIAIQRFLKAASSEIDYQHVLIVGGHTFDYVGRQNPDSLSFIPTFYAAIGSSRFTPSDQPFVDFDGDGFPEKSIGRWPVREPSQVATIAQKSLIWASGETEREAQGHGVLLLGDQTREFDFATDLDTHFSKLTNIELGTVDRVYVDQIAQQGGGALNQQVQQQVFEGFANNKSWVFYNGHGSPNAWSFSQMLAASRVADLENDDAPVLITSLGCYTTYYESPTHNSLALQLMFAGNNAAVAIHGPSVVGGYQNQLRLANSIADEMHTGRSIGDSIRLGMRGLPLSLSTAVSNWALLGDPSLPVQ